MPDNTAVAELNDDEDSFFGCTFPLEWDPAIGFFPQSSTLKSQASSKNLLRILAHLSFVAFALIPE